MKTHLITLLLVVCTLLPTSVSGQLPDSLVLGLMDQYDVPGLSLSIVHGDSISTYGWGYADADRTIAVTPDTPFRIASVAKVLVAATVATEVAAGTVRFDEDILDIGLAPDGYAGPITLHDLLTHTAGFDERLIGYGARSSDEMKPLEHYLTDRMPSRGWPVGEQISYSNHGMSLAGYVVERARSLSFAEVARSNVFVPLEMHATRFLTRGESIPANSADPLRCTNDTCESVPFYYSHAYPAGLLFSSARDMSRFISALLQAETSENPLATLIPERFTHDERIPGMSYGFFNQYHKGVRFLSHAGSVPGYWSLLMISPEADMGFFFTANGGESGFGQQFRDVLLDAFLEDEAAIPPAPSITEDPSVRAGIYESTRYSHNTIERFPQVFHNSIEVTADADTLILVSGGRLRKYIQTGEALYQNINGSDKIAFGLRQGKTRLFRSSLVYGAEVPVAYEKRPWYRAPGFLNEYVSWLLGLPILVLMIAWPLSIAVSLFLRKRRGGTKPPTSLKWSTTWMMATLTAALFIVFGLGFVARSNRMLETGELFFGVPDTMLALTWIPFLHVGLTALMCVALVAIWKNRWWNLTRRLLFSIVTALIVLQVVFLAQWNYLPPSW
ncbi:MAG: beta-lactamase family protein [Rhodothermaceae bacterium]|nr:beta-lactamase family protein [Rhodothermaceae bacterium]